MENNSNISDASQFKTLYLDQYVQIQNYPDLLRQRISQQAHIQHSNPLPPSHLNKNNKTPLTHSKLLTAKTIAGPPPLKVFRKLPTSAQVKLQEAEISKSGSFHMYKGMLPDSDQENPHTTQAHQSQESLPLQKAIQENQPSQFHVLYDSQVGRRPDQPSYGPKKCKMCAKDYSCNSALFLHLRRKHQARRLEDGRIVVQAVPSQEGQFRCEKCGLTYGSKGALSLHFENKHNVNPISPKDQAVVQQKQNENEEVQRCGCGLFYQSKSALHLHVKKKHGGIYPEGTPNPPRSRRKYGYGFIFDQSEEEEKNNDIYHSDSEEINSKNKPATFQREIPGGVPEERTYRCGCGRTYGCSSALNYHIKRNHNWVVPKGTVGGPRGFRKEEQEETNQSNFEEKVTVKKTNKQKVVIKCCECSSDVGNCSHFQCRSCARHYMCSNCFWKKDNFCAEHEWVVTEVAPRK